MSPTTTPRNGSLVGKRLPAPAKKLPMASGAGASSPPSAGAVNFELPDEGILELPESFKQKAAVLSEIQQLRTELAGLIRKQEADKAQEQATASATRSRAASAASSSSRPTLGGSAMRDPLRPAARSRASSSSTLNKYKSTLVKSKQGFVVDSSLLDLDAHAGAMMFGSTSGIYLDTSQQLLEKTQLDEDEDSIVGKFLGVDKFLPSQFPAGRQTTTKSTVAPSPGQGEASTYHVGASPEDASCSVPTARAQDHVPVLPPPVLVVDEAAVRVRRTIPPRAAEGEGDGEALPPAVHHDEEVPLSRLTELATKLTSLERRNLLLQKDQQATLIELQQGVLLGLQQELETVSANSGGHDAARCSRIRSPAPGAGTARHNNFYDESLVPHYDGTPLLPGVRGPHGVDDEMMKGEALFLQRSASAASLKMFSGRRSRASTCGGGSMMRRANRGESNYTPNNNSHCTTPTPTTRGGMMGSRGGGGYREVEAARPRVRSPPGSKMEDPKTSSAVEGDRDAHFRGMRGTSDNLRSLDQSVHDLEEAVCSLEEMERRPSLANAAKTRFLPSPVDGEKGSGIGSALADHTNVRTSERPPQNDLRSVIDRVESLVNRLQQRREELVDHKKSSSSSSSPSAPEPRQEIPLSHPVPEFYSTLKSEVDVDSGGRGTVAPAGGSGSGTGGPGGSPGVLAAGPFLNKATHTQTQKGLQMPLQRSRSTSALERVPATISSSANGEASFAGDGLQYPAREHQLELERKREVEHRLRLQDTPEISRPPDEDDHNDEPLTDTTAAKTTMNPLPGAFPGGSTSFVPGASTSCSFVPGAGTSGFASVAVLPDCVSAAKLIAPMPTVHSLFPDRNLVEEAMLRARGTGATASSKRMENALSSMAIRPIPMPVLKRGPSDDDNFAKKAAEWKKEASLKVVGAAAAASRAASPVPGTSYAGLTRTTSFRSSMWPTHRAAEHRAAGERDLSSPPQIRTRSKPTGHAAAAAASPSASPPGSTSKASLGEGGSTIRSGGPSPSPAAHNEDPRVVGRGCSSSWSPSSPGRPASASGALGVRTTVVHSYFPTSRRGASTGSGSSTGAATAASPAGGLVLGSRTGSPRPRLQRNQSSPAVRPSPPRVVEKIRRQQVKVWQPEVKSSRSNSPDGHQQGPGSSSNRSSLSPTKRLRSAAILQSPKLGLRLVEYSTASNAHLLVEHARPHSIGVPNLHSTSSHSLNRFAGAGAGRGEMSNFNSGYNYNFNFSISAASPSAASPSSPCSSTSAREHQLMSEHALEKTTTRRPVSLSRRVRGGGPRRAGGASSAAGTVREEASASICSVESGTSQPVLRWNAEQKVYELVAAGDREEDTS